MKRRSPRHRLTLWQPHGKEYEYRHLPPHNDKRWPPWWTASKPCFRGFTMYRCSWCSFGTARQQQPPAHCAHCGFSIRRMVCNARSAVRSKKTPVPKLPPPRIYRPELEVLAIAPWDVVDLDPFADEVVGERTW